MTGLNMKSNSWNIYWNEYAQDSYLYGSEIVFHKSGDVEFKNDLMPPSTVIKRWRSKTSYQSMRIEPTLPLIDGEGRYHIRLDADCVPEGSLLLKLVYYDRYDSEAGFQIIRDSEGDFKCPIQTMHYEVQLISSGVKEFCFHSITIKEITDEK